MDTLQTSEFINLTFIPYSPRVKGQELGSLVSSSVTSSNLLTTSKTLNTQRNTGAVHI